MHCVDQFRRRAILGFYEMRWNEYDIFRNILPAQLRWKQQCFYKPICFAKACRRI